MDGKNSRSQTQPKVAGSSHAAFTSSNDDTSHPSISEPQPTVSSQDVSIPAPNSTQGQKRISAPGTSRDAKIARISPTLIPQDVSIPAPQGRKRKYDPETSRTKKIPRRSQIPNAPQQPVQHNITIIDSNFTNSAIASSNINQQSNRTSTQLSDKLGISKIRSEFQEKSK
ncbi:uncharacterized protein LOC144745761 [Ciona intestinalis]